MSQSSSRVYDESGIKTVKIAEMDDFDFVCDVKYSLDYSTLWDGKKDVCYWYEYPDPEIIRCKIVQK